MTNDRRQHALYRFFAEDGALLYVGITLNPAARFKQHSGDKEWWGEISDITIETHPSREAVLEAERAAILAEQPRYNVVYNRRQEVPKRDAEICAWVCDSCSQPIPDGAGYIHLHPAEICQYLEALEEWKRENPGPVINGAALMEYPPGAAWYAHHRACDPDLSANDYWFDVSRARTALQLLDWTLHLSQKDWFHHTDWAGFIYSRASLKVAFAA